MNKHINMVKAYRNTKLGRAVARLFGEEVGAFMMEYVIAAVVIAAACALIFAIWGKSIFGGAEVATHTIMGEHDRANEALEAGRTEKDYGVAAAVANQNTYSDSDAQSAQQH